MAHFAKLDSNNIVERIEVVHNDIATDEEAGINFLKSLYGSDTNWKQTSYNTDKNNHTLGGTPFRKNYARKGSTYDETKDAFIAPKPYSSWVFNETTCVWEAPIEKPDNVKIYDWNEENTQWDLVES
jgi:hypothetical protein|tara:strand:- start:372 stop:752 length:381 start_codon:yes stop_codon:yes gene_type:complete